MLLTEDGQLYVCGRHTEGQLGLGDPQAFPKNENDNAHCDLFRRVEGALLGKTVTQVACGAKHTVVLCSDNELYGMGDTSKGQYEAPRGDNMSSAADQQSVNFTPKLLRFYKDESWKIKQIASAHDFTALVVGKREPHSLRTICADFIKGTPELMRYVTRGTSEALSVEMQVEAEAAAADNASTPAGNLTADFQETVLSLLNMPVANSL